MFLHLYFTYKIAKDFFKYMHFYQKTSLEVFGSLILGLIAFQMSFIFDYVMMANFETPSIGITIIMLSKESLFFYLTCLKVFPFICKLTKRKISTELEELSLRTVQTITDQYTAIRYCQIFLSTLTTSS